MKYLKEGELISEFKTGIPLLLKIMYPMMFLVISFSTIDFYVRKFDYFSDKSISFFFGSLTFILFYELYKKFYLQPNDKNPSVFVYKDYLLVKSEFINGEVEVPFKMIKRFRLSENNLKVLVEYKEDFIFRTELDNKEWVIVSNPKYSDKLPILNRPNTRKYPQDKKDKIYPLGEFSFRLKTISKSNKISIVDDLNRQIV